MKINTDYQNKPAIININKIEKNLIFYYICYSIDYFIIIIIWNNLSIFMTKDKKI
jgi:hypothetical protein